MPDSRSDPGHSFLKCEAVKVAYRQTKDGMVVSFAIHPSEMPPELALAPVGTRVLLAVAEIGDAERPAAPPPAPPDVPARPKSDAARERGKAAFRALPDMKKDVVKAALLIKDVTFQGWILGPEFRHHAPPRREEQADRELKRRIGIQSKAEIGEDYEANERFHTLKTTFERDTNQLAEIRS